MIRLLALSFCMLFTTMLSAVEKPNIIYILLDDAGYGDLSCYGQKKFQTPNIDKLAAEGMKFTDHYSGSTVCAPTRCCLMMGVHTGHSYVRGNREVKPEGQWPIPADSVSIPRLLKKAGYATGMFGKWGLGAPGSHADPMEHFDEFYGYNCQRHAHTYYPDYLWKNNDRVKLDGKTYSHDLIAYEAMDFIKRHKDGPFFCYMSVTIPHAAMHAPEESVAPFRKKFPQFEDKVGKYKGPHVKNPIAAFAGMMTHLDNQVGELLAELKTLGIDEKTIVLLSSDNGPHLEGGHDPRFFDSNGPLKGFKRDLTEGGVRTPLLVRWPGKIKAGSVSSLVSAHWDMLPTFCELAGVDYSKETKVDGISIVPTLLGQPEKQQEHKYLYWEYKNLQAVRSGAWKGIRSKNGFELYNLSQDLGETNNIAGDSPKIVEQLTKYMEEAHTEPAE